MFGETIKVINCHHQSFSTQLRVWHLQRRENDKLRIWDNKDQSTTMQIYFFGLSAVISGKLNCRENYEVYLFQSHQTQYFLRPGSGTW